MPASGPRRRAVITAIPVAAGLAACTSPRQPQPAALLFFTGHQAAVIEAATARIAPGPEDDPAETGHPGGVPGPQAVAVGPGQQLPGALAQQLEHPEPRLPAAAGHPARCRWSLAAGVPGDRALPGIPADPGP